MTTQQATPSSALHWFEIPVFDMDRAQRFYETLLATPLRREAIGPNTLAVFTYDETGVGGCLIAGPNVAPPATHGSIVYLGAEPSLDTVLARVGKAGGTLLLPKTALPGEMGCFAHIADSEGNRVGLHAMR